MPLRIVRQKKIHVVDLRNQEQQISLIADMTECFIDVLELIPLNYSGITFFIFITKPKINHVSR